MLPTKRTPPTHLYDTCVFIDHLRGQSKSATELITNAAGGRYYAAFSILTEAELWAGGKNNKETRTIRILLTHLRRLPLIIPIARQAGEIRKKYGIHLADAIIAATAEYHSIPVYTRNARHFKPVSSIKVIEYTLQ